MKNTSSFFRFRLRFRIAQTGKIRSLNEQRKRVFVNWKNKKLAVVAFGSDSLGNTDTFDLSAGGYASADEAAEEASSLRLTLMTVGAALGSGLGIAAPQPSPQNIEQPQMDARFDCEDNPVETPIQMVTSRSDFIIFEQTEADADYVSFEAGGMVVINAISPEGLFETCAGMIPQATNFSSHQKMVLELFNAAYFENSVEAKFLTWMLAMEAISNSRRRPDRIVAIVQEMRNLLSQGREGLTKIGNLTEAEVKSLDGLKTTLEHAENESISQAMQRIANDAAGHMIFGTRKADSFMKYCYNVRSTLVHSGNIGKYKEEFGEVLSNFEILSRLILMKYLGIGSFRIPDEEVVPLNFDNLILHFL
jgi:hypothetical protein